MVGRVTNNEDVKGLRANEIETLVMNKFRHMLDFLKEESLEFNPVHQLRNQGAA